MLTKTFLIKITSFAEICTNLEQIIENFEK